MKVRISRHWWIEKDLKWILDNADFIFITNGDNRPRIYTKEKIDERYNCFKIDADKYGITLNSTCEYSAEFFETGAKEVTRNNFLQFIEKKMIDYGAGEYFNPRPGFFDFLKSKKDKIIEI